MKELTAIWTKIMASIKTIITAIKGVHAVLYLIFFLAGGVGGCIVSAPHEKSVNNTTIKQGNIITVQPLATVTNFITSVNSVGVTNYITISNIVQMWTQNSNFDTDPFVFHQEEDKITASLFTRTASTELKPWLFEKSWYAGPGIAYDFREFLYGGQVGISKEWGLAQLGFYANASNAVVILSADVRF